MASTARAPEDAPDDERDHNRNDTSGDRAQDGADTTGPPPSEDDEISGLVETIAERADALAGPEEPTGAGAFVRRYYDHVAHEDLTAQAVEYLAAAALAHWRFARDRAPGEALVRVRTPHDEPGEAGELAHSVAEIVTDDMPFLVDSVTMELDRHGLGIHLLVHPIIAVRRAGERFVGVDDDADRQAGDTAISESFIRVEFDRTTESAELEALESDLRRVLADVAAATADWRPMAREMRRIVDALDDAPAPVPRDELADVRELLAWMADDHFTFLGYGEYDLVGSRGAEQLVMRAGTGLGILGESRRSEEHESANSFARLPADVRAKAYEPFLLTITKANSRATVHRATYLDYVGIKRFDRDGSVVGEWRFLGLWSSAAYQARARDIPLLRGRVAQVLEHAGFPPRSHSAKDLLQILEELPRDELFQMSAGELYDTAMGILALQERKRTKIFVRRDPFRRFVSALVYLPRERYNTATREEITDLLVSAFAALSHEFQTRVSESRLARLHFVLRTDPADRHEADVEQLERRIAAATRTWTDELRDALIAKHGEEDGLDKFAVWSEAFPVAYQADYNARSALGAIPEIEALGSDPGMRAQLAPPAQGSGGELDFTLYVRGDPPRLSSILPILGHMGVDVVDEHPYIIESKGAEPVIVQRFGLRCSEIGELGGAVRHQFEECFHAVVNGATENDGLNRLVLWAGLSWREVAVVRAYSRYLRQCGTLFGQGYIADAVAAHAHIARRLVELFVARFDPRLDAGERERTCSMLSAQIVDDLDAVESLDHDRILRGLLALVQASVRTNWFAPTRPPALAVKLDPAQVPDLPAPRPRHEIWVYAPTVEGVHLRSDSVARGGIRWSDRAADFRTEVLGLMKAQRVKNTVIVPAGAKGGFVVKRPDGSAERPSPDQVVAAYRAFVGSLLDVTDNLVAGKVVTPEHVVRYDGDDTYIVAAADKGTATFSDIANEIALARGYWLGDAFASGGSVGYDHKEMGITARGAWTSVQRHFRELGVDVDTTDITVVGVGDMSGDVFGNGMLLSERLRLVGAFDHRHVFLDPDPDPTRSFAERRRLFELPGSSWADYDSALISPGGGIYPRSAKAVTITPQVRARLGLPDSVTTFTPNDAIRAILAAPVDLLWNGGIGTYVKATGERHTDVGDKSNDALRLDASELRCRVVAEGGNLGLTQAARVEYALAGGRVNADFIDNSGGVDASDHEVNIKVVLDAAVGNGSVTHDERDRLLLDMTDDVAALVLRTNYRQNRAIANSASQAPSMEDVHARYIRALEHVGILDRALEGLPDDEALANRRAAGLGLAAPELAVLLSYSKIALEEQIRAGDVPDDPDFVDELVGYFPPAMRDPFRAEIDAHPLRRGIVSTELVNRLVNAAGITFVFRMEEETGAPIADIVRAHRVARVIFDLPGTWSEIEALDNVVPAEVQTDMYLESRKLTERASRWLLRHRRRPLPVRTTLDFFGPGVRVLAGSLPAVIGQAETSRMDERIAGLLEAGVPEPLARKVATLESLYGSLDIVDLALRAGLDVERVGAVYYSLGERLHLDWLTERVLALPRDDRWKALARTALRDDAQAVHRELTSDVLAFTPVLADPEDAYNQWLAANENGALRALGVVEEIRGHGSDDLPTLTVALRELRNLAQPG